jgi:hypothetical protein|nr:MAG TPA: hypothetical protein [Herelleviridae sp.]
MKLQSYSISFYPNKRMDISLENLLAKFYIRERG